MGIGTDWQQCNSSTFWREIAPDDHVVQLYDDDAMLIDSLRDYVADGFNAGDSMIIIATPEHLELLDLRLLNMGYPLEDLRANDRYICVDADECLKHFMVNGAPNEFFFIETVSPLIQRARRNGGRIRAFGEMVVLLWERGNYNGTLELEQLWNKFCAIEPFCLFCAYPKSSFNGDASAAVMHVCGSHTKHLRTDVQLPSQLEYQTIG